MKYLIEVEKAKEAEGGRPSMGPVYRSVSAKDGLTPPVPGLDCCWDVFRKAVEKYPNNRMLGLRKIVNGKVILEITYKEVYDIVIGLGNAIRSCGVEPGGEMWYLRCQFPAMDDDHAELVFIMEIKEQVD